MATLFYFLSLSATVSTVYGQAVNQGNTAFDALDGLGCSQFKAIIQEAYLEQTFQSAQALTLFVFNDTAYSLLPPSRLLSLYDKQSANNLGAKEYVYSFTLPLAMETSAFSDAAPMRTYSVRNRKAFLNKKELRIGNVASGIPGPTKYFINGAMLIKPNIQAGMHIIHVINQVLDTPLEDNAIAYVTGYNPSKLQFMFYTKIMEILQRSAQEDGEYNYNRQVVEVLNSPQVTFFIPSDEALNMIPVQKLSELQGNLKLMLDIVTLHIIPNQVLYTSLVNHNERFNTQFNSGAVVFRKNFNREAVYVTGQLKGGRTVTAKLNPANITVMNGVVHQIDNILGFVYKTAIEEISIDPLTQNFEQLIYAARKDLQNYLTATNGVTVFAPTNAAMFAVANVYQNYINNQSLINMVLEMSLLQQGQYFNLMDYNGGYESYKTAVSRYNGRLIKVYSEGNDTWVEGGYVKARVLKPDIGVTNGVVHQIDAVFGIPVRDIPYTIFCEDWLVPTYIQLQYLGLDKYMRDPTLTKNLECVFSASAAAGSKPPSSGTWITNPNSNTNNNNYVVPCGEGLLRCEFTYFVPNGTAIENFALTPYGRQVMNDPQRWRWLMRRLMTYREKIYIDQLAVGAPRSFYADNGEELIVQLDSRSNIPSGQRTAYIMFQGIRAQVVHSDIGATNGVIHIISSLLFVPEDLARDVSGASTVCVSFVDVLILTLMGLIYSVTLL
ncbi:fasciclin-1-like [Biomphalaria glabrata]|uniref:Fasciclin-1-like n=1 Tax=Biomphalaria glabrata TaxID=6526 RepID=A0A9W2ZE69_BIOGL|nr:fasciclin-1-like [Biomphalaria glabrata]KAI8752224.1 fasciclin-1-like [Biomphalaria glabrata]